MIIWTRQRSCQPALAGIFLLLFLTSGTWAADLIVDDAVDIANDGQCSLIEAIINANDNARTYNDCNKGDGDDRILITGPYDLVLTAPYNGSPNGLPVITDNLEIIGFNINTTIRRDAAAAPFRLIKIQAPVVRLEQLTLSNGVSSGIGELGGGAINVQGGNLDIHTVHFIENRAEGIQSWGGALYSWQSDVLIEYSQFRNNQMALENYPEQGGGAIAQFGGEMEIRNSALIDNAASVPCDMGNPHTGARTGGAMWITPSGGAAWTKIYDSTIAGNTGRSGGGIMVAADSATGNSGFDVLVDLVRTTLVRNDAVFSCASPGGLGDGIYVQEVNGGTGVVQYTGSILHGNGFRNPSTGEIVGTDCGANFPTQVFLSAFGNVLDAEDTCTPGATDTFVEHVEDVLDMTLQTNHFLPLADGPAVDNSNLFFACPTGQKDQLGKTRADGPGAGGDYCDAGAIELYQPAITYLLETTLIGGGDGQVTSSPAGIDCPGNCSNAFESSQSVQLTAQAETGSEFLGWSGECSGSDEQCTLQMTDDRQVTAEFAVIVNTLAVDIDGAGSVVSSPAGIDCPDATCLANFDYHDTVELTATPAAGYQFAGWSGDCSAFSCQVDMSADRNVTAMFEPAMRSIDVTLHGMDQGRVVSNPAGIDCPGDCFASFDMLTTVELTVTPEPGNTFSGWDGACTGTDFTCSLYMDSNYEVDANFDEIIESYTLIYTAGTGGFISGDSPQTVEHGGDGTSVEAVADNDYHFVQWSDGITANPRTDTNVTSDITVEAEFLETSESDVIFTSRFEQQE